MEPGPQLEHLFHGTGTDLTGHVSAPNITGVNRQNVPAGDLGRGVSYGSKYNASASERETVAWQFAHMTEASGGGRAHVYTVGIPDNAKPGAEHPDGPEHLRALEQHREWIAPQFPIKDRIDIKPGHQGTLPHDWSDYIDNSKVGRYDDNQMTPKQANHPTPEQSHAEQLGHLSREHLQAQADAKQAEDDLFASISDGSLFNDRRGVGIDPNPNQDSLPFHENRAEEGSPRAAQSKARWSR